MKQKTKDRLAAIDVQRTRIKNRLIKLRLGDNLEPLDLSDPAPNGLVECQKDVYNRYIIGAIQISLGVKIENYKIK